MYQEVGEWVNVMFGIGVKRVGGWVGYYYFGQVVYEQQCNDCVNGIVCNYVWVGQLNGCIVVQEQIGVDCVVDGDYGELCR